MDITVYTVNGCHYCSQMKELLRRSNLEFKKVKVGEDITREEFLENYPEIWTNWISVEAAKNVKKAL